MEVVVAGEETTALAAKQAAKDIPIVIAVFNSDPVATGLANSLRRPGGNLTGISILAPEMAAKRLELLREIIPGLMRVAVLWSRQDTNHPTLLRETDHAARQLGLATVPVEGSEDIEDTFKQIVEKHIDAVDMLVSPQFFRIRSKFAELGLKYRLPIIGGEDGFAQFGGLINYGPSLIGNWRQAAVYVDKILKGEKSADLPISQPTKFELAINLKTAKALGLTVSPTLLALASEVIE